MFDKLVVSEPEKADQKSRRGYFMVSSVVVGVLFITAVVISIFAADYGLGNSSFELSEIITPPDLAVAPEREEQPQRTQSHSANDRAIRTDNIARTDEPRFVPISTSSVPNTGVPRPRDGRFEIGRFNSDPLSNGGRDGDSDIGRKIPGGDGGLSNNRTDDITRDVDPPPARVVKPVRQTLGVINGRATYLPKPVYSPAAKAVNAQGQVNVQVAIDETGRVTSANAVSGHAFLRPAAEQAAREAKFSVTYLSKVPVKVTGVIVYNFIR